MKRENFGTFERKTDGEEKRKKKVGSDFASDSKFWQKFQEGRKRRFKMKPGLR